MNQKQPSENKDDFRQIMGIGQTTAQRLYEAGIHTYAQLTAVSPEELANLLTGISLKRIQKEDWQGQAEQLSQSGTATVTSNGQHYATFTVELLLDEDNTVRRTRIVHIQQEDHKKSWAGWQPKRLQNFISQHARLVPAQPIVEADEATAVAPTTPPDATATPYELRAESIDEATMRFVEPATVTSPETAVQPATKPISSANFTPTPQPLSVELDTPNILLEHGHSFNVQLYLDLAELADERQMPLNYQAAIYAARLGSGARQKVGTAYGAINTAAEKVAINVPTQIARPGTYRLEAEMAVAWIPAKPDLTANSKGGLLHVY